MSEITISKYDIIGLLLFAGACRDGVQRVERMREGSSAEQVWKRMAIDDRAWFVQRVIGSGDRCLGLCADQGCCGDLQRQFRREWPFSRVLAALTGVK